MNVLIVAATKLEITSDKISNLPILITGVGMLNTAINLTKELNNNDYDLVINIGVAGCFSDEIKIGKVVEVVEDCFPEIGFEDGESFSEFSDFNIKMDRISLANFSSSIIIHLIIKLMLIIFG